MQRDTATQFLRELRSELGEVQAQMEEYRKLRDREAALKSLIAQTELLLSGTPVQANMSFNSGPSMSQPKLLNDITRLLRETGHPLTAAEVFQTLKRHGRPFTKAGREIVRGYLKRHHDVFQQVTTSDGTTAYALVEWPEHMKAA